MNAVADLEATTGTSNQQLRELGREVAPEDFLDMVNRLENKLKLQQMRAMSVLREISDAKIAHKQTEDRIQVLDMEQQKIRAITGYREPEYSKKSNHICSRLTLPEQETLLQELRLLRSKIKEEVKYSGDIVHQKDKVIETLTKKNGQLEDLEEQVFGLRVQLNAKCQVFQKISEEYEEYRKEHLKADKVISRLENTSDNGCRSSLMQDKLFLKAKIYQHVDKRRAQDKAIKAQQFRLNHLKDRLEMITNAVEDLKLTDLVASHLKGTLLPIDEPVSCLDIEAILPSDELIDMSLFELLARDVKAIQNSIGLKEIILREKEATIESLDEKVERVMLMNEEDILLKIEDIAYLEHEVVNLEKEVKCEREVYINEISDLRRRKTSTQKKVVQARSQRSARLSSAGRT